MRARCAYALFWLYKAWCTVSGTLWGNGKLFWWGIKADGPIRAVGSFRIEKHPGATIRLGRRCCLRSARCSNIAGIDRPVTLAARFHGHLEIGNDCGISGSVLVADQSIVIGDRVMIGVNCSILDTDFHPLDAATRIAGAPGKSAPVVIEDDVWLCMNVTVLKGVTIGRGSVIAAGSVVTADIPAGVLAGGVPAKAIKPLSPEGR